MRPSRRRSQPPLSVSPKVEVEGTTNRARRSSSVQKDDFELTDAMIAEWGDKAKQHLERKAARQRRLLSLQQAL